MSAITSSEAGPIDWSSIGPVKTGTSNVLRAKSTTHGLISRPVASKPAQRSIATNPPWPLPSSSTRAGGRRYFSSTCSQ